MIVTIEEVTGLTGQAARVAPAVRARYWTGQAHAPAPVLVGAPWAMPATLVSQATEKGTFSSEFAWTGHSPSITLLESDIYS